MNIGTQEQQHPVIVEGSFNEDKLRDKSLSKKTHRIRVKAFSMGDFKFFQFRVI